MGLFGGYQNPGPGINPNAPKKKPFFRFWELLWRNFGKLLTLNLVYTLCHAPLLLSMIFYIETDNKFTTPMVIFLLCVQVLIVGPTLAGCAKVLRLIVLDKPFFFGEEFKKGFKKNFGASLLYWLLDLLVIASVVSGYWVYPQLAEQSGSNMVFILFGISLSVAIVLLFMNYYMIPLQVTTTLKKSSVMKNSFMLSVLSVKYCLLTTLGIAVMLGIVYLLLHFSGYLMFLLAFFPAAFIGYLVMFVHYPIIQKYVINPYYEQTGEENPEAEDVPGEDDEERVFTDHSDTEQPVKKDNSKKGKVIS